MNYCNSKLVQYSSLAFEWCQKINSVTTQSNSKLNFIQEFDVQATKVNPQSLLILSTITAAAWVIENAAIYRGLL